MPLYGKNGAVSGRLDKAPMMDFSVVDQILGVATLISPQYVAGLSITAATIRCVLVMRTIRHIALLTVMSTGVIFILPG
nr:S6 family peptidase [Escherichia coli]